MIFYFLLDNKPIYIVGFLFFLSPAGSLLGDHRVFNAMTALMWGAYDVLQIFIPGIAALAATINAELADYNDLQDFAGLSDDQWAQAIGVQPPQVIRLPLVRR